MTQQQEVVSEFIQSVSSRRLLAAVTATPQRDEKKVLCVPCDLSLSLSGSAEERLGGLLGGRGQRRIPGLTAGRGSRLVIGRRERPRVPAEI